MLSCVSKTSLLLLVISATFAHGQDADPKFQKQNGKIHFTDAGRKFVDEIKGKEVAGTLRKIKSSQARSWVVRFAELSDREAMKSPDFTPLNNLYNHLVLCDKLLQTLVLAPNEGVNKVRIKDRIKAHEKEKLDEELEKLRNKLNADIATLIDTKSQADFRALVEYLDKALRETTDMN